jgi:hypothetical protein
MRMVIYHIIMIFSLYICCMVNRVVYIFIFFLCFLCFNAAAEVPASIINKYHQIINLIRSDNVVELSKLVAYPLRRPNPIPDIENAQQFIAYYPMLFDSAFKSKLQTYDDSDVFEHNVAYGLVGGQFHGDIWVSEDYKISGIYTDTEAEKKLIEKLTAEIKSQIYPSINSWEENQIVAMSKNLLIRIDWTGNELRYASWSKGRNISEKPDIVMHKGKEEFYGTMGGRGWTFKNGDWTYVVEDINMCETEEKCGLFLRLKYKGVLKSSIRLQETK